MIKQVRAKVEEILGLNPGSMLIVPEGDRKATLVFPSPMRPGKPLIEIGIYLTKQGNWEVGNVPGTIVYNYWDELMAVKV